MEVRIRPAEGDGKAQALAKRGISGTAMRLRSSPSLIGSSPYIGTAFGRRDRITFIESEEFQLIPYVPAVRQFSWLSQARSVKTLRDFAHAQSLHLTFPVPQRLYNEADSTALLFYSNQHCP